MLRTTMPAIIASLSLSALSGCVTTSMVKKPEVDSVKTIAVVAVYSNTGVKNTDGESETSKIAGMANMVGLTGNNSKAGDSVAGKLLDFGGTRLVEHAKQELERELARVKGWKVIDASQFVDKDVYQKFATKMDDTVREEQGVMRKVSGPAFVTVPRMAAMPYGLKADARSKVLKQLATDLGVDAVAILKLDMAYSPSTSIGGNGTAAAAISSNLEIVNKEGGTAVLGSLNEIRSADTVGMMAGSIIFSEKTEKIFKQAISRTAEIYTDKINKDI
jgi:hypothetical protein